MLTNYLKIAIKVLARRKVFTAISLFGIGFTLLVLMVATALLDHVFAPHPPEVEGQRTLGVFSVVLKGERAERSSVPGFALLDRLRDLPHVEATSLFRMFGIQTSYVEGRKVRSFVKGTDAEFWRILEFERSQGRVIDAEDVRHGSLVAVINESTRGRLFGTEGKAVGATIDLDGRPFQVVGVVEDVPILRLVPYAEIWVPYTSGRTDHYRQLYNGEFMAIFLAEGREYFPLIKNEVRQRVAGIDPPEPFDEIYSGADTLFEFVSRQIFGLDDPVAHPGRLRLALVLMAGLFMLLPTINLVNINLSRILERSSEIGVRRAFGASSRTLVVQFVVENLVLTLIGAALGLVASALALSMLDASQLIPYSDLRLNLRIFGYGVGLAVVFGVLSGVYPAWRMSRLDPVLALRGKSQ